MPRMASKINARMKMVTTVKSNFFAHFTKAKANWKNTSEQKTELMAEFEKSIFAEKEKDARHSI